MRKTLLLIVLCILVTTARSQNYFQQEVNYTLWVRLDDQRHMLRATEDLFYTNNSPDTLKEIWFHLWPNGYRDTHTDFARQAREQGSLEFQFSSSEDKGSIDSLDFSVDGKRVMWESYKNSPDMCRLILDHSILPGGKVRISTPFRVKIPSANFSRLGHTEQSYFISQWYPKPAVYDREGWHPIPYLNQGEFYSEFGSFDVFITVPANYIVASTGNLTDCPAEERCLDSLAAVTAAIKDFKDLDTVKIPSAPTTKTVHYFQDKTHDFAWFADKHYHYLKGEVTLPNSQRKVKTAVFFTEVEAKLWKDAISYVNNAIYYYSLWVGEYPYDHATALQGVLSAGAGMEYPTITIIGRSGYAEGLEDVIVHEVGHNWFYGILGSDERDHPWLDEGINSYYEDRYMEMKYPRKIQKNSLANFFRGLSGMSPQTKYFAWSYQAKLGLDMPITMRAQDYPTYQYGLDVYMQSSMNLNYLEHALGQSRFDTAMQAYYSAWKFKHPQPADFKQVIQKSSHDSLNWFFDDLLNHPGELDYKLSKVKRIQNSDGSKKVMLVVKNKGSVPGPFPLSVMKGDKVDTCFWFHGFDGRQTINIKDGDFSGVRIDASNELPEVNRRNNMKNTNIFCEGWKPFQFKLLYRFPDPKKNTIYFLPAIGANAYDKFMLGLLFYNDPLLSQHWEWAVVPLYAFGTKQVNGMGRIAYTIHPKVKVLKEARLELGYKKFSFGDDPFYETSSKFTPSLEMEFRSLNQQSPYRTLVKYRIPSIHTKYKWASGGAGPNDYLFGSFSSMNELSCTVKNVRQMHPWSAKFVYQKNKVFERIFLVGEASFVYNARKKSLHLRTFFGHYLQSNQYDISDPGFHLSGISGLDDIYFDGIFAARSESSGILSQQFIEDEGGMKTSMAHNVIYNDLLSFNAKLDFPFRFPLRLFIDVAYYPGYADYTKSGTPPFSIGLSIPIMKPDIVEIFFPLYSSNVDTKQKDYFYQYREKIRFTFNLQKLDFFKMAKKANP
ncbi:MAG: M1 family metallopeptidase [Bacteroidota bacterium]